MLLVTPKTDWLKTKSAVKIQVVFKLYGNCNIFPALFHQAHFLFGEMLLGYHFYGINGVPSMMCLLFSSLIHSSHQIPGRLAILIFFNNLEQLIHLYNDSMPVILISLPILNKLAK